MCTAEPALLPFQPRLLRGDEDASQSILVWQGNYRKLLEPSVCGTLSAAGGLHLKLSKMKSHHCRVKRRKGEKAHMQWKSDYFSLGFTQN